MMVKGHSQSGLKIMLPNAFITMLYYYVDIWGVNPSIKLRPNLGRNIVATCPLVSITLSACLPACPALDEV